MIFATNAPIQKVLHISVTVLFFISLLSGLRLAFDNPYMSQTILEWPILPQGNVYLWHEISAYFWLSIVAFATFAFIKRKKPKKLANKKRQLVINTLYIIILLQCISGTLVYAFPTLFTAIMLPLHFFLGLALLAIVIIHIGEQLIKRSLTFVINMFMLKKLNRYGLTALTLIGLISAGLYYQQHYFHTKLIANKIPLEVDIRVDGKFDEPIWQHASSATVYANQGNDYFTATPIEVKMLHNGLSAYFAIRWKDESPSYSHLPLIKTANGWQAQHNGFAKDDERTFYEDKFALMLSKQSGLAGAYSIHLGKKPLDDKPASRSGRGFHYTLDNEVRDVWHWKAVRVERMSYLDDNHFTSPAVACEACPRYKAGYDTDPKDSGAFRANWQWFLPNGVTPLRLPIATSPADLGQLANQANMSWFETIPYTKAQDNLPIGTRLPSVLTYEGFEGDRANVAAKGHYQDGYWHLELSRNLVTESAFDLPLQSDIYLWMVTFDHAQSRHNYHLKPLKLQLQQHIEEQS